MKIFDKVNMSDSIYDNSDSNKIKGRVVITDTRTGKTYESHNTVVNNGKKLLMNALMGYGTSVYDSSDGGKIETVRIGYVGFGQSTSTGNYGNAVSNNDNKLNKNIINGGDNPPGNDPSVSKSLNGKYIKYGDTVLGKFIEQSDINFKTADNENSYPYLQIDFSVSSDDITKNADVTLSEIALFLLTETRNVGSNSVSKYAFPVADQSAAQFSTNANGEIMFSKVDIGKSLPLSNGVTYNIKYYIYF